MSGVMKLAYLVFACMILAGPITANPAIICDLFTENLTPCADYVTEGGQLSSECCNGVRNFNSQTPTTPDRQQACACMKFVATYLGPGPELDRAAGLPQACGVTIPYKISSTTNCSTVK